MLWRHVSLKVKKRGSGNLIRIDTINQGKIIEGPAGKFFSLDNKAVLRVRLFGIVANVYINEERTFGSLTIDDGSDTIRLKLWKGKLEDKDGIVRNDLDMIENITKGMIIDVLGKVKEYDNEIYIVPEGIFKQDTISWEIHRRSKLFEQDIDEVGMMEGDITESNVDEMYGNKDQLELVFNSFFDSQEDNTIPLISQRTGIDESDLKDIIIKLQTEGRVLNPKPGYYLKV
jgi:hypothetical protein